MSTKRIYLDHAATTPLDERVRKAMEPFAVKEFGNPSALYREGVLAKSAVFDARKKIAKILFAHADEIIFTGSGTEANNLAIQGVVQGIRGVDHTKPIHIITSVIEHPSVLSVCQTLEKWGVEVSYIGVDKNGIIDLGELKKAIKPTTVLVSVMYANNEIGTMQPIREIAKTIRTWRKMNTTPYPYFHTDACQAMNYLDMNIERLGVDLMTLNGSKIYGPKGTGALFMRRGVSLAPIFQGGGQEQGLRPGTENVAGIVGLGEAVVIAEKMKQGESKRLTKLRDYFIFSILKKIPDAILNGDPKKRLANSVNISIPGVESENLIIELDAKGIAASAKSACKSMDEENSHVIMALGRNTAETESGVRFTLGRSTTKKNIDHVIRILPELVKKLRSTPHL